MSAAPGSDGPINSVGLIGIGAMGLPMALRLREQGFAVAVNDINAAQRALAVAAGCSDAGSAAAAAKCEALIVAVVDAAQTEAVLFGQQGAAAALRPGTPVLLCPTLGPDAVEAFAARLLALGHPTIDAPMSGGPARARNGQMSLMLAAPGATLARCDALLATLAAHRFVISERPGDGARTKLVNNLLAAINLAGAAEALQLAQALGLDAPRTLAVLQASSGASWIAADRGQRHLDADPRVLARVAMLAKDTTLALAMAEQALLRLGPLGVAAQSRFAQAVQAGLADADDSVLFSLNPGPPAATP